LGPRTQVDQGSRPGLTTDERARLKELEREVRDLRRANAILKTPQFSSRRARRSNAEVVTYIDARKSGGESSHLQALQFAPTTYYAAKTRPPARAGFATRNLSLRSDACTTTTSPFTASSRSGNSCSARPLGRAPHRPAAHERSGTARRRRGRRFKKTTFGDDQLHRPSDLVDRQFVASAPNRLWVADLTYVKSHSG